MNSVDELNQRLNEVWNSLQQNVIDLAINEWRKELRACVHEDGQHFEHIIIIIIKRWCLGWDYHAQNVAGPPNKH